MTWFTAMEKICLYCIGFQHPNQVNIGLLGPNGCGKTTIMNILSKTIIPNFSLQDNAATTEEDVLKNVRGTELQKYLKMLYDDKLVVNTKNMIFYLWSKS